MTRRTVTWLGLAVLTFPGVLRGAERKTPAKPKTAAAKAALFQKVARQDEKEAWKAFAQFRAALLGLQQRLRRGTADDKAAAGKLTQFREQLEWAAKTQDEKALARLRRGLKEPLKGMPARLRKQVLQLAAGLRTQAAQAADTRRLVGRHREITRLAPLGRNLDEIVAGQRAVHSGTILYWQQGWSRWLDLAGFGPAELTAGQQQVIAWTEALLRKLGSRDAAVRKLLQAALPLQKKAARALAGVEKDLAVALRKLEQAQSLLNQIHQRLRAEQRKVLLGTLEDRCREMLKDQRGIGERAWLLNKNRGGKLREKDRQLIKQWAQAEQDIIRQAARVINLLDADGSAPGFVEVFRQVQSDMGAVARLLGKNQIDKETQGEADDVEDMLSQMIAALAKARKQLKGAVPK
jgi:hypothetical protein